ncbi:MAG TPA: AtpZ/AtpI family protein [Armatimonadota bacterium]|nr:AtpZ/AtpI family protein [Armatimonadota bacterium]
MAKEWREGELGGLALIAGGFILVSLSFGGYIIGSAIDKFLHSSPYGSIIGLIVGTLIGFYDLFRIASRVMKHQPVPTAAQQRAAKEQAEKFENSENSAGDRDENHE